MARYVRVEVYESNIARDFAPGGQVYREMQSLERRNTRLAKASAPTRTHTLRQSITGDMNIRGFYECGYTVGTDVDYAHYVLGGTTGPIVPKKGKYLWMRPLPHSWLSPNPNHVAGRWPFRSVRGQKANNFLERSMREALLVERVLL